MKIKRIAGGLVLILILALLAGCGKEADSGEAKGEQSAATELPVDIVSQVAEGVTVQTAAPALDDGLKNSYTVLLDGCSESEAGYYMCDLTGDGTQELILGTDMMTVYSYNQGSVMTIGTLAVQEAWLSEQYGFIASCVNDGAYELRQYQYDGEMFNESVLVSADSETDFDSRAADYLKGAQELKRYELTDRSIFE